MCPDDLRSFLLMLEQTDQLVRIPAPVDPQLELATIVELVSKGAGRGRGLLFENVSGAAMPVAANLYGSPERVSWAIGTTDLQGLAQRLSADLWATGQAAGEQALQALCAKSEWQPVIVNNPHCRSIDCSKEGLKVLPQIRAWPDDGGAYLTLSQVFTRHPDGNTSNCGMYRIQCLGSHRAAIRCRPGSGAARHLAAWHERGLAMPVAVALGGPPVLGWAASAPLPEGVDEVAFCGYLLERRLGMSACHAIDLHVPASAEVVIEGVIEPGAVAAEGPFGNHTGSYDADSAAPLLKVLAVHTRPDAIYPWTLVGPPPMENIQLARATACLFKPLVAMALPSVRDIHLPDEGIFHHAALVTVDAGDDRPLSELARLLWGTALLRGARLLVVGAADHDPGDPSAVFWRVLNRVDWTRDLLVAGKQLAIDARRLPAGGMVRSDPQVLARVLDRWREFRLDGSGE